MKTYIFNALIALDQLVNALIGGSPDETLSASAWRTEKKGRIFGRIFRPIIDLIFSPFEKDHCYNSFMSEKNQDQLPKDYE